MFRTRQRPPTLAPETPSYHLGRIPTDHFGLNREQRSLYLATRPERPSHGRTSSRHYDCRRRSDTKHPLQTEPSFCSGAASGNDPRPRLSHSGRGRLRRRPTEQPFLLRRWRSRQSSWRPWGTIPRREIRCLELAAALTTSTNNVTAVLQTFQGWILT